MYKVNFEQPIHIHFIGIGGISMSGLAEVLLERGFTVSGSDMKPSPITEKLESHGAMIHYGQCAENITDDIDLAVYTAAIHPDNPEYKEVLRRNIPHFDRAELLGQIMSPREILGCVLMFCAIILAQLPDRKKRLSECTREA